MSDLKSAMRFKRTLAGGCRPVRFMSTRPTALTHASPAALDRDAGLDATPEEALRSLRNTQSIEMRRIFRRPRRYPIQASVDQSSDRRRAVPNLIKESSMATLSQLINAKAIATGSLAVGARTAAGSGHPTSALSLAHLIATLMYHTMRWRPEQPRDPGADRLVLSEGHAVPIIYAACADLGAIFCPHGQAKRMTVDDLMTLREIDSPIDGHPNPALGFPFFDAATGSLGQGLSVAGGLGCAARIDGIDKVVYCIIGDGESREGQIWEAMDFIRDQRLSNVVALFNCSELGQSDFVSREQDWTHLQHKAEAFGWTTVVIDGHDPEAILAALGRRPGLAKEGQALVIIARTVKGWGVPALQGTGHHGTPVPKDQLDSVLGALDQRAKELGVAAISQGEMARGLPIAQPTAAPTVPPPARPPAGLHSPPAARTNRDETGHATT